ncbi:hypothetical protein [Sporichthya sp.]|uniref:hypothetical protein n=1 Tax=Sporichthya sp. TaxID=65475 RepID=UPI0017E8F76F|nr:hypothetical protein [Sporichthya sp.]MBA3744266.1 hypothetical protein [Sporichthya sp.]
MTARHVRPVSRDLPSTPDDARDAVDQLDAKVDAEVRAAAVELSGSSAPAADRAPESPAPEPPD